MPKKRFSELTYIGRRLNDQGNSHYETLHDLLEIYVCEKGVSPFSGEPVLMFSWRFWKQKVYCNEWNSIKIEFNTSRLEMRNPLLHFMAKLEEVHKDYPYNNGDLDNWLTYTDPAKLVQFMAVNGMERVAYDNRIHKFVTQSEAKGDEYRLYQDLRVSEPGWCAVLAYNEEDAREQIEAKMRQTAHHTVLGGWISEGRMVRDVTSVGSMPPYFQPLEELLALPEKELVNELQ